MRIITRRATPANMRNLDALLVIAIVARDNTAGYTAKEEGTGGEPMRRSLTINCWNFGQRRGRLVDMIVGVWTIGRSDSECFFDADES